MSKRVPHAEPTDSTGACLDDLPPPVWRTDRLALSRRGALTGLAACAGGFLALGRAGAQDVSSCVLTPDSGEGPFYFDPSLVRADITEGLPGAPLTIAVRVVRAEDCATLENARVDLWHADALGLYSGYERQSGVGGVSTRTVAAARHLRGTQFTDADGRVDFRTIYPSWYGGRTPHLHFKVFLGGAEIVSSQIFFDDAINDRVFNEWEPYRTHVAKRATRNEADMFLTDEVGGVFCEADAAADGVTGTAVVAVARSRA